MSSMSAKGVVSSTATKPNNNSIPHDKIAMRAFEKWCKRGQPQGSDRQDWLEAEAELMAESKRPATTQRR